MSVTDDLVKKAAGILEIHPEVSDNTGRFYMFDDGGTEVETSEFLYGLVRVLKPERILETGTYTGISSMYMAQGLKDNERGFLNTLEVSMVHKERAQNLWKQVGVDAFVLCFLLPSLEFKQDTQFDLIFLDSEPEFRFQELIHFYDNLKPGGFLLIHDLHHHLSQHPNEKFFGWPFGKLPEEIVNWLKEDKLRFVPFPTPRGLAMFYKTKEGDFRV